MRSPARHQRRATLHRALGDPLRLAIIEQLTLGDAAGDELCAALEVPSNLLAHHLGVLERVGLIARTASHGDGRRRYLRLVEGELDALADWPRLTARCVLFVCTGNSARSQLAAALWRARSAVPASSAGSAPAARVHPAAVRVAASHGLDLTGAVPRSLAAVDEPVGLVITVCDVARESADRLPAPALHWSLADPVGGGHGAFEQAFSELDRRIRRLAPRVVAV